MQLCQSEAVRAVDDDRVCCRNINTALNDRGADQDIEALTVEIQHYRFQVTLRHLPVCDGQPGLRNQVLYLAGDPLYRFNLVMQEKYLSAALQFPQQRFTQHG